MRSCKSGKNVYGCIEKKSKVKVKSKTMSKMMSKTTSKTVPIHDNVFDVLFDVVFDVIFYVILYHVFDDFFHIFLDMVFEVKFFNRAGSSLWVHCNAFSYPSVHVRFREYLLMRCLQPLLSRVLSPITIL